MVGGKKGCGKLGMRDKKEQMGRKKTRGGEIVKGQERERE